MSELTTKGSLFIRSLRLLSRVEPLKIALLISPSVTVPNSALFSSITKIICKEEALKLLMASFIVALLPNVAVCQSFFYSHFFVFNSIVISNN